MPDILSFITHTLTAAYDSAIGTPASAGVSAIFKFISNTKSKKQIRASLEKELKGLVDSNLIFQSAAFTNYITYQNPSEKILVWLKESKRIPEAELLDRLTADACGSLRSGDLTVGIPEEQALREFYRKILKIFRESMGAKLDEESRGLLDVMCQQTEGEERRMTAQIQSEGRALSGQLRENQRDMAQGFSQVIGNIAQLQMQMQSDPITLSGKPSLPEAPCKYQQGSEKRELVGQMTAALRSHAWIHLYGKLFTGKTQTLVRVAERLGTYLWVQVDDRKFREMDPEMLSVEEGTVVILDGIPKLCMPEVREKCLQIFERCQKAGCRLITSGYEDVTAYLEGYLKKDALQSFELKGLTDAEVDEIARKHGASEAILKTKGYRNFAVVCRELPPILMEVIQRFEENDWKLNDEILMTILQRRTAPLTEQMAALFQEAVPEEETRRLYYRMLYAGQELQTDWIRPIAAIPEAVTNVDQRMNGLLNRWYYREGCIYRSPNKILEQYAADQLGEEEKRQIDRFLVQKTRSHSLTDQDISNLLTYYGRLQEFDQQGLLCIGYMENMIKQDVRDYYIRPESFWVGTPFPEKMSPMIRCYVRLEQMYMRAWKGVEEACDDVLLTELWEYAKQEPSCRELIVAMFMRMAGASVEKSLQLLEALLREHPEYLREKGEIWQKLAEQDPENVLVKGTLLAAYNGILYTYIAKTEQLKKYLDLAERYFTREDWQELERIKDTNDLLLHMLLRVDREKMPEEGQALWEQTGRLYRLLDDRRTLKLWSHVLRCYLVQTQEQSGYEKAKEIYASVRQIIENSPVEFCENIDMMARIAHDHGQITAEKAFLQKEMAVLPQMDPRDFDRTTLDSGLMYLSLLQADEEEEIEKVHQELQRVAGYLEEEPCAAEKAEAEYWMRLQELGLLEERTLEFVRFVKGLLEEYDRQESEALLAILTKMVHALGYISAMILRQTPPERMPDGSFYTPPRMRMFWNEGSDRDVIQFWQPEKRTMAYLMCGELAEFCGEKELSGELMGEVLHANDFWTENIGNLYRVYVYPEWKMLELGRLDSFLYILPKNYRLWELEELEQKYEALFVCREIFILSLYIAESYAEDKERAIQFCKKLCEEFPNEPIRQIPQEYYAEYRKILNIVTEEDADYTLLKDCFDLVQRKKMVHLDSAMLPLLRMEVPADKKAMIDRALQSADKALGLEDDFIVKRILRKP